LSTDSQVNRERIAAEFARLSEADLARVYHSLCKKGLGETASRLAYKKPLWIANRIRENQIFDDSTIGRFRAVLRDLRKTENETRKREIKRAFKHWRRVHRDADPAGEPDLELSLDGSNWRIYRTSEGRRGFTVEKNGVYIYGPDTIKRCREKAEHYEIVRARAETATPNAFDF